MDGKIADKTIRWAEEPRSTVITDSGTLWNFSRPSGFFLRFVYFQFYSGGKTHSPSAR